MLGQLIFTPCRLFIYFQKLSAMTEACPKGLILGSWTPAERSFHPPGTRKIYINTSIPLLSCVGLSKSADFRVFSPYCSRPGWECSPTRPTVNPIRATSGPLVNPNFHLKRARFSVN